MTTVSDHLRSFLSAIIFTRLSDRMDTVIPPLNSLTSPGSRHVDTSLESWVGKCRVPSENHLSLKAKPDLRAVCRALHCEGQRRGNGGRTCQLSHCARNTYELYWEHVSSHVHYQRSPVTSVFFFKHFRWIVAHKLEEKLSVIQNRKWNVDSLSTQKCHSITQTY